MQTLHSYLCNLQFVCTFLAGRFNGGMLIWYPYKRTYSIFLFCSVISVLLSPFYQRFNISLRAFFFSLKLVTLKSALVEKLLITVNRASVNRLPTKSRTYWGMLFAAFCKSHYESVISLRRHACNLCAIISTRKLQMVSLQISMGIMNTIG